MKKVTLLVFAFIAFSLYLRAADPLQQYTGKYKFPPGSVISEVNVVFDNGVLSLSSAMGNTAIEKTSADSFAISHYSGTAVFTRNDQKKINGLKIDVMGISLEGIKEDREVTGSTVSPVLPVNKSTFPLKYLPALVGDDMPE